MVATCYQRQQLGTFRQNLKVLAGRKVARLAVRLVSTWSGSRLPDTTDSSLPILVVSTSVEDSLRFSIPLDAESHHMHLLPQQEAF